jgi:hypothetical protein
MRLTNFPVDDSHHGYAQFPRTDFVGRPIPQTLRRVSAEPTPSEVKFMKNQLNALLLTAALAGLTGGTTVAAHAQNTARSNTSKLAKAGLRYTGFDQAPAKHSCKGKNDCKGQGGCKSSDNGCSGKNSCKGKGGCATDGSKMPPNFV